MSRALALVASLAFAWVATDLARAEEAPALRAGALVGWDGRAPEGAATELALQLYATRGGEIALDVTGTELPVSLRTTLTAGEPRTLALAVRPLVGTRALHVRITGPDGAEQTIEAPVELVAPGGERLAVAAGAATLRALERRFPPGAGVELLSISPHALRRVVEAYDAIDALVLDADAWAALDATQLRALEAHLAACGRLVSVSAPPAIADALAGVAGCGGASLARVASPDEAADVATTAAPLPPLPEAAILSVLAPPKQRARRSAAVVLALGGAALLAAGALVRRPPALLALPLLGALLPLAIWSRDAARIDVIALALQESGDASARWRAIVRVEGEGRGEASLALPRDLPLPRAEPGSDDGVSLQRGDDGVRLAFPIRLLAMRSFALRGATASGVTLALALEDGLPVVSRTDAVASSGALLLWHRRLLAVPALGAGGRWTPPLDAPSGDDPPELARLASALRSVGVGAEPLLVVPFVPPPLTALAQGSRVRGWLAIKPSRRGAES